MAGCLYILCPCFSNIFSVWFAPYNLCDAVLQLIVFVPNKKVIFPEKENSGKAVSSGVT